MNHLDLVLVVGGSELVNGGEEARSPVNCFEFEYGVLTQKEKAGSFLGRKFSQEGGAPVLKSIRLLRLLKRVLETIRVTWIGSFLPGCA